MKSDSELSHSWNLKYKIPKLNSQLHKRKSESWEIQSQFQDIKSHLLDKSSQVDVLHSIISITVQL